MLAPFVNAKVLFLQRSETSKKGSSTMQIYWPGMQTALSFWLL